MSFDPFEVIDANAAKPPLGTLDSPSGEAEELVEFVDEEAEEFSEEPFPEELVEEEVAQNEEAEEEQPEEQKQPRAQRRIQQLVADRKAAEAEVEHWKEAAHAMKALAEQIKEDRDLKAQSQELERQRRAPEELRKLMEENRLDPNSPAHHIIVNMLQESMRSRQLIESLEGRIEEMSLKERGASIKSEISNEVASLVKGFNVPDSNPILESAIEFAAQGVPPKEAAARAFSRVKPFLTPLKRKTVKPEQKRAIEAVSRSGKTGGAARSSTFSAEIERFFG